MIYPKIDTLFERDKETFVVDPTKLKRPVFGTISDWDVTEKVDGTNIRVIYHPGGYEKAEGAYGSPGALSPVLPSVRFAGRSDAAIIPGDLLAYLKKTFTPELFASKFQGPVVLYGEGYGAGIQKVGGLYRPDKSFILFDVLVDGAWWMNTQQVRDVAESLGIDVVPYYGRYSLYSTPTKKGIIELVQTPFPSTLNPACPAEGIVARPIDTLFDSRHERVILKLKTKDFQAGKR